MGILNRIARAGIRALSRFEPVESEDIQADPMPGRFFSDRRNDYAVDASLRKITPQKLGNAMRDADEGSTQSQYEVFEMVEQDPHVSSVSQKRRRLVTSKKLIISPYDEGDNRAVQAADLCNEIIYGVNGQGGIENWHDAIRDMTDAIAKAFALAQIVWVQDGGRWNIKSIDRWPQVETQLGDPYKLYAQDQDTIKVLTDKEPVSGEVLADNQWVQHVQKAWSQPIARASLMRGACWYWLFKKFSYRDWAIFIEKYGMPLRIGKYNLGADEKERSELWTAVRSLGKDAACMIPKDSMIDLVETKSSASSGAIPHPQMIDYCNDEISKLFMGSTMTVDPGERGARSQGEVYERGEEQQTLDDCLGLARTIRRDICRPIILFNLGADYPLPKVEFQSKPVKDLNEQAKRDALLVTSVGLPVEKSYFYNEYGIPEPAEDGDLVDPGNEPTEPTGDTRANKISILADAIVLAEQKKKSLDWVKSKN